MRSFIVMTMFVASLALPGWTDYEELRDLDLGSDGISRLSIKAGAGSMDVAGVDGLNRITVKATIVVPDTNEDDALKIIAKDMTLSLQRKHGEAWLEAWFDSGFMGFGTDSHIDLEISVPQSMAVSIDDGSGSINVANVFGGVIIDDGSGLIDVSNVADLKIVDGSGSIDIVNVAGDVSIVDGSGSISVRHIAGSVTIDDGSGSIRVSDVENDLIITDDGSGSLSFSDIRGTVEQET